MTWSRVPPMVLHPEAVDTAERGFCHRWPWHAQPSVTAALSTAGTDAGSTSSQGGAWCCWWSEPPQTPLSQLHVTTAPSLPLPICTEPGTIGPQLLLHAHVSARNSLHL